MGAGARVVPTGRLLSRPARRIADLAESVRPAVGSVRVKPPRETAARRTPARHGLCPGRRRTRLAGRAPRGRTSLSLSPDSLQGGAGDESCGAPPSAPCNPGLLLGRRACSAAADCTHDGAWRRCHPVTWQTCRRPRLRLELSGLPVPCTRASCPQQYWRHGAPIRNPAQRTRGRSVEPGTKR
jgi:hypothetical protein